MINFTQKNDSKVTGVDFDRYDNDSFNHKDLKRLESKLQGAIFQFRYYCRY